MMTTDSQNIQAANDITRRGETTLATVIRASSLVPLPAYGTRLRGVMFVDFDGATGFVIQLGNQSGIARITDLLCLATSELLCCVVKRFADIAGGARKRLRHLTRGFVEQIAHAAMRLRQHLGFAPLQTLPLPGALRLRALGLTTRGEAFVAVLHRRLRRTATDQEGFVAIGGRDEGIDAKVHAHDGLLWPGHVGNLADQADGGHTEADFHQAPRQGPGEGKTQPSTGAMRQEQASIPHPGILIGVHYVVVARLSPGIARCGMPCGAELACRVDSLTELANELLSTLGAESWIASFAPPLPPGFTGPREGPTA